MPALNQAVVSNEQLYQLLFSNQYLDEARLKQSFQDAVNHKSSLYEELLQKDLISDENLGKLISDFFQFPFVVLGKNSIDPIVLNILPESVAKSQQAIVFKASDGVVKIATSYPYNPDFFANLAKKTALRPQIYFATPRDIEETLTLYKRQIQSIFEELLKTDPDAKKIRELPIVKIVDTLIQYAYDDKASDIHIEPGLSQTLIRFRIDGVLHDMIKLPIDLHEQIISRIKVTSKLRTDEHLSPQDGKMHAVLDREDVDIRVSIVPIVNGEKCVMRLLTSKYRSFGLTDLGMDTAALDQIKDGFTKPYGMILSTGPTGSGKTTSMYAILKILNTRERNIATIEDPVEYNIAGINQIQVNPKSNLTFAEGLRSILRQDPDVIYVGEIRDKETAGIAINSAMTGHLVLSTLHTNDAATSLPRLIDMDIEPFLVASTVNIIIGQRLLRRICEKCRVSYTQQYTELIKHFPYPMVQKHLGRSLDIRLYHGKGCPVCHNTGYVGRVGVFEVLMVSDSIRQLISQKANSDVIAQQAIKEGMITMMEDGLAKVQQGITTIEEVLRATKE